MPANSGPAIPGAVGADDPLSLLFRAWPGEDPSARLPERPPRLPTLSEEYGANVPGIGAPRIPTARIASILAVEVFQLDMSVPSDRRELETLKMRMYADRGVGKYKVTRYDRTFCEARGTFVFYLEVITLEVVQVTPDTSAPSGRPLDYHGSAKHVRPVESKPRNRRPVRGGRRRRRSVRRGSDGAAAPAAPISSDPRGDGAR